MAGGVPHKTLSWLYDVLKREYRDPNRTYSDLAHVLGRHPGFGPRTDVYTFENGSSALLVHFQGTIPVNFRGSTYRFPISLWVPHSYPYDAPIAYVTPTDDMVIRPGQYVGGDGRIYHPYLAHWRDAWDRSSIIDFLSILSDVFAKEPPVMSRTQQQQRPPQTIPPPVPPLPREVQSQGSAPGTPYTSTQSPRASPGPPPPPPKDFAQTGLSSGASSSAPPAQRPGRYDAPPPLPSEGPLRPQVSYGNGAAPRPTSGMNYMPQRTSSLRQSTPAQQPHPSPGHDQSQPQQPQYRPQPPRPGDVPQQQQPPNQQPPPQAPDPRNGPQPQTYNQNWQRQQPPSAGGYGERPTSHHYSQSTQLPAQPQPQPHQQPVQGTPYAPPQQRPYQQAAHPPFPQPQPQAAKPAPPPNLLDSPFDLPLPVANSSASTTIPQNPNIPVPPIPVNPEKEALVTHLSHQLTQSLHQQITQSTSALPALSSQNAALQTTLQTLSHELSTLQTLHTTLTSNLNLLSSSLSKSDKVISSAHARSAANDIPAVDEMLVPPTVVARQLYDAACEERGIEAAILALQEGFVRGRIGADVWSRRTRELAREGFKRRWLERKVARGIGLDMGMLGNGI